MTLSSLPSDVLSLICSYLDKHNDYLSLLRVDRQLNALLSHEFLDSLVKAHRDPIIRFAVAAAVGNERLVRIMLQHGAKMEIKDNEYRLLHQVPGIPSYATVRKIMSIGPNIRIKYYADRPDGINLDASALEWAIERNNVAVAQILLTKGADIEVRDDRWRPVLHQALLKRNHFSMINLLVDYGADMEGLDDNRDTPLYYAVRDGNELSLWALLARGARTSPTSRNQTRRSVLGEARYNRLNRCCRSEITVLIVQRSDDITNRIVGQLTEEWRSIWSDHLFDGVSNLGAPGAREFFEKLDSDFIHRYGGKWLHTAVEQGRTEVIQLLLERGADIDREYLSMTPLDLTITFERAGIYKLLLEKGAKNPLDGTPERVDALEGWLHRAIASERQGDVQILLGMGVKHEFCDMELEVCRFKLMDIKINELPEDFVVE